MTKFDSLAIARQLTDAGIERAHADAIADGISRAAEHGDHVTPDAFAAGLAALRTEISAVRTEIATTELRLIRWIIAANTDLSCVIEGPDGETIDTPLAS